MFCQTYSSLSEQTSCVPVLSDLWQIFSVSPATGLLEWTAASLFSQSCHSSVQSDLPPVWLDRPVACMLYQNCSSLFHQTCYRSDRNNLPQVWLNRPAACMLYQNCSSLFHQTCYRSDGTDCCMSASIMLCRTCWSDWYRTCTWSGADLKKFSCVIDLITWLIEIILYLFKSIKICTCRLTLLMVGNMYSHYENVCR